MGAPVVIGHASLFLLGRHPAVDVVERAGHPITEDRQRRSVTHFSSSLPHAAPHG